jgi:hypothetical protein
MPHIRTRGNMIRMLDGGESLSRSAADLFGRQARQVTDRRVRLSVPLFGGHSAARQIPMPGRWHLNGCCTDASPTVMAG